MSVSMNCPLIERLFFESSKSGAVSHSYGFCVSIVFELFAYNFPISGRDESLKLPTCVDLVNKCPNIESLALRGFKLHDCKVRILVKV